jgi:hypothetical protein
MNVFERRNYPVISLLKYLSYYITKLLRSDICSRNIKVDSINDNSSLSSMRFKEPLTEHNSMSSTFCKCNLKYNFTVNIEI